jgi:hypothetical protein
LVKIEVAKLCEYLGMVAKVQSEQVVHGPANQLFEWVPKTGITGDAGWL